MSATGVELAKGDGARRRPPPLAPQAFRLAAGGLIERGRSSAFTFDGRKLEGHPGDTLASALVANGVRLVGRSFKYHRPRGILSAGPEEPNALVELRSGARREPNTRATTVELYRRARRREPEPLAVARLRPDGGELVLSPILARRLLLQDLHVAGRLLGEGLRAAASGAPPASDARPRAPTPTATRRRMPSATCWSIGSGAAGLMAALSAARSGARVILCRAGFPPRRAAARRSAARSATRPPRASCARIEARARSLRRMCASCAAPPCSASMITASMGRSSASTIMCAVPPPFEPRQRAWRIVAKRCVLAAGAIERPLVFGDNDRPGVMLAGAARTYAQPLRRAAWPTARSSSPTTTHAVERRRRSRGRRRRDRGARRSAARDRAGDCAPLPRRRARASSRARVVTRAIGGQGVRAVEDPRRRRPIEPHRLRSRRDVGRLQPEPASCDASRRTGRCGTTRSRPSCPATTPRGMTVAGAARGTYDLADCLAEGARLGAEAAEAAGFQTRPAAVPQVEPESAAVTPLWRVRGHKGKAFVDFQNDVTDKDVELAEREGFRSVEHLKRYTTLGMATDQGKTANVNGLAVMAEITERSIPQTGVTTFRPPFTPVAIGALAGHARGKEHRPTRLTPSHEWAQEQGAVFVESGLWLRAQYFPQAGDRSWFDACNREVNAVRSRVGVCDVSTLGKIDIQGADAAEFLERALLQLVEIACRRQGALRPHAARGRLRLRRRHDGAARPRPLPHDHHHGECRGRDAAHRFLPSGAVARARRRLRLGDRAMGAICDRRAEIARASRGKIVDRAARHLERGLPLYGLRRGHGARRASRRGSSASPSRASSPMSSACRAATATRSSAR